MVSLFLSCTVDCPEPSVGSPNPKRLRVGRGSQIHPTQRFLRLQLEDDLEYLEHDPESVEQQRRLVTEYLVDDSQTIVSENNSPDIPFRYSVNIYRGCSHGCAYCYARPTHEFLNMSAGLDFESKILVKSAAPRLFRAWLARDGHQPEPVVFSGVTDTYQPVERQLQMTRRCLEVAAESLQPVSLITKNHLITRDLDLLQTLSRANAVRVAISITTLDQSLTRSMEPRTSSPQSRLNAIQTLASAGIPVTVMIAPVIPGLNDHEIPLILKAAREAGAQAAGYLLLRLPGAVEPVFREWLARAFPNAVQKVESRIRSVRQGQLNQSAFKVRMRGTGPLADHIRQTFHVFATRQGLQTQFRPLCGDHFRRPRLPSGQQWLFPT